MVKVNVVQLTNAAGTAPIPVALTNTVYTRAIAIPYGLSFAVWLKLTSAAGSVSMTITVEESYTLPATEGAADDNWVTPANVTAIVTDRTAETAYMAALSPVVAPYLRLKIVGTGSNNADSLADIRLLIQDEVL